MNEWMNGPTSRPDLTLKSRNRNRPRSKKINKPKQKREKNFDVLTIWIKIQEMRRAGRENPVLLEKRGEGSSFYRWTLHQPKPAKREEVGGDLLRTVTWFVYKQIDFPSLENHGRSLIHLQ